MQYLKRNTRFSILTFLIIILYITISISTLAKTEVYPACACLHADRFSLYDNPQILLTTSLKPEVQIININTASQEEFIKILQISEPLARKIIVLKRFTKRRIQRTHRPSPTTRDNQPRLSEMERRGDNNYY